MYIHNTVLSCVNMYLRNFTLNRSVHTETLLGYFNLRKYTLGVNTTSKCQNSAMELISMALMSEKLTLWHKQTVSLELRGMHACVWSVCECFVLVSPGSRSTLGSEEQGHIRVQSRGQIEAQ